MLLLRFQAGNERYGLDVSRIIEVIPMVLFLPRPQADQAVAGIFNYHGTMVPVIDLTVLLTGSPSRQRFSTRVILLEYPGRPGEEEGNHILGLLAEQVTETVFYREEDMKPAGIAVDGAPYLGDILVKADGMIQRIAVERLLPPSLQKNLFPPVGVT